MYCGYVSIVIFFYIELSVCFLVVILLLGSYYSAIVDKTPMTIAVFLQVFTIDLLATADSHVQIINQHDSTYPHSLR